MLSGTSGVYAKRKPNEQQVDVSNCIGLMEFMREISKVLRGKQYSSADTIDSYPENVPAFTEYVEDWIETFWGEDRVVRIAGIDRLSLAEVRNYIETICAIRDAEMNVLEEKLLSGNEEARDNLERLVFLVC
jgi:hypothetical protein